MTDCDGERPLKLFLPPQMGQRHDGRCHRRPNVGPHDHRHGVRQRQRVLRRRDHPDDHGRRHRRALDERGSQQTNNESNKWILGRDEKPLDQIIAKQSKPRTKAFYAEQENKEKK